MTDPTWNALDCWLHDQNQDFLTGLTERLDLEAGLREVLLAAQDRDLLQGLNERIDLEAGLAAINPSPALAELEPTTWSSEELHWVETELADLPLAARLALRTFYLVRLRYVAARTRRLMAMFSWSVASGSEHVTSDSRAIYLGQTSVDQCATRDPIPEADHIDSSEQVAERREKRYFVGGSIDVDRALRLSSINIETMREVLDKAPSALAEAQMLAAMTACSVIEQLQEVKDLSITQLLEPDNQAKAQADITKILDELVAFLFGLQSLLNDFVGADLRNVDLRGVSLEGVRWSAMTTQWPDDWRDQIRRDSVPVGEGVFEVHYDTGAYQSSMA